MNYENKHISEALYRDRYLMKYACFLMFEKYGKN